MPAAVTSAFQRLGSTIRSFSIAQRTVALIGIAVLILGIVALTAWLTKPSYSPLFSGVGAADANSIVEQLRTDGVPYELANGGATILVPNDKVYDERLKAAAAGLPSSNTDGYALLDKMGVTSSEFQQSVTYKRALEGELASTIEALDGVKTASVQLAIPKDTVFAATKADPTASVFVETQNGVTLTTEQVQAIVHLTSASIENMAPTDVSVVDAKGNVLSTVGSGATGTLDQQASGYEQRVRTAVQAMLDKVVGPGNATVAVAADVSQETGQRTEETFTTPTNAPALNETSKTESYQGNGGAAAGVLGPDNISVPAGSGSGTGAYKSQSSTKNNAVDKVTQSTNIPAGTIKRQTVSVAVDAAAAKGVNIAQLTALVNSAAGIDPTRGDAATVQVVNFNQAGAKAAQAALSAADKAAAAEQSAAVLRTALTIGGVILMFLLGLLVYARRSRRQRREPIETTVLRELEQQEAPMPWLQAGPPPPLQIPATAPVAAPGAAEVDRKRAEIAALAQQDPARTADYLRSLMDDRQPV